MQLKSEAILGEQAIIPVARRPADGVVGLEYVEYAKYSV
jgi:hypothetical protein